jgi:hypothetical protein
MSHPYANITFFCPPCAIPSSAHLKNQAKLQHCIVQSPLSSPHHTSFLIHHWILFAMKSRWFTVNPVKLKKFLNVMLQAPKLRVPDAMKLENFSDKDIADLSLWHFLQRSLPGGTIKAMKVHLVGLLPPKPLPPDCHNQRQKRSVEDSIINVKRTSSACGVSTQRPTMRQFLAASSKAATAVAHSLACPPAMAMPAQTLAIKRKLCNQVYYKKRHVLSLSHSRLPPKPPPPIQTSHPPSTIVL